MDFDPRGARYVALRWTPNDGATSERGFDVAEIDAFGNIPLAMLTLDETPDLVAGTFRGVPMPGEGPPEVSNGLGTIAIPPVLPPVSP